MLKFCHFLYDSKGYQINLYYLRHTDKRELDFLVTLKNKPWFAIEVKLQDTNINRSTYYFKQKINIPYVYQVIKKTGIDIEKNDIRVIFADRFLYSLV